MLKHLICSLLLCLRTTFDLIRHNVSRENALLCLLPLNLKCSQRAEQFVNSPRWLVLASIYRGLVLITVHCCVHVRVDDRLFKLWTLLAWVT